MLFGTDSFIITAFNTFSASNASIRVYYFYMFVQRQVYFSKYMFGAVFHTFPAGFAMMRAYFDVFSLKIITFALFE